MFYSNVAQAYNQIRPHYPPALINRLLHFAQLPPQGSILEIGCGPATATVDFASLGFKMLCLEPSLELSQLAEKNCSTYPDVIINNTKFENYQPQPLSFDAVLAATSIHWVPPEIVYPSVALALKNNGVLILLWNASFQSQPQAYEILNEVYQQYAPALPWFETKAYHQQNLKKISETALASRLFREQTSEEYLFSVNYTSEEYLLLLSTFSPYIKLDLATKEALFKALKSKINQHFDSVINLSWLSMFQIFRKISH